MTTREEWFDEDLDKIAKGWSIAMSCSKERLRRVYQLKDSQLEEAVNEGRVVLETVCLFTHACVKRGQYRLPLEFWRVLHSEYGIVVYPTALTEEISVAGLGIEVTFTEAYRGHIGELAPLGNIRSRCIDESSHVWEVQRTAPAPMPVPSFARGAAGVSKGTIVVTSERPGDIMGVGNGKALALHGVAEELQAEPTWLMNLWT